MKRCNVCILVDAFAVAGGVSFARGDVVMTRPSLGRPWWRHPQTADLTCFDRRAPELDTRPTATVSAARLTLPQRRRERERRALLFGALCVRPPCLALHVPS